MPFFIRNTIKVRSWALSTYFNNLFNKVEWSKSTCFLMVIMSLSLWYVMKPFLHLLCRPRFQVGLYHYGPNTSHDLVLRKIHMLTSTMSDG